MAAALVAAVGWGAQTPAEEAPGREVFRRKNCQHCHAVATQSLARTGKSEKSRGPDLSAIGLRMSREEIVAYLEKGAPLGSGESHWRGFWGDEKDLQALADWLSSLRQPPPAAQGEPAALPAAAGG
jgi:hypothetical protein